jgi:hypothetical protein
MNNTRNFFHVIFQVVKSPKVQICVRSSRYLLTLGVFTKVVGPALFFFRIQRIDGVVEME